MAVNLLFIYADKKRDRNLALSFKRGCAKHGDNVRLVLDKDYKTLPLGIDIVCIFGLKGNSKDILRHLWQSNIRTIYFDGPYIRDLRRYKFYRVSIDSFHPLDYFQQNRPDDRWKKWGVELRPRQDGYHIIFAGSSQKYYDWHDLGDATSYAQTQIDVVRKYSDRPIVYRPKHTWKYAVPIKDTRFSRRPETIERLLRNAHALVAYETNAATDAILNGIPAIVLGNAIAKSMAEKSIANIENPYFPSDEDRYQWCCDLAYCQWSSKEYASGEAWDDLRRQICLL